MQAAQCYGLLEIVTLLNLKWMWMLRRGLYQMPDGGCDDAIDDGNQKTSPQAMCNGCGTVILLVKVFDALHGDSPFLLQEAIANMLQYGSALHFFMSITRHP